MTSEVSSSEEGGFVYDDGPTSMLSPPASTTAPPVLPQARKTPLKPGSAKETQFILFVDQSITQISRRHALRLDEHGPEAGYTSFAQVASDITSVMDIVWISGSPPLQIPYLLNIAMLVLSILPSFPAAPKQTFRLLDKLDVAFYSLLTGINFETGESLSGSGMARGTVSVTERVRLKSVVDRTRLEIVKVLEGADQVDEDGYEMDESSSVDEEVDRMEMNISRVYDRTVTELGTMLGGTPIGIQTDD